MQFINNSIFWIFKFWLFVCFPFFGFVSSKSTTAPLSPFTEAARAYGSTASIHLSPILPYTYNRDLLIPFKFCFPSALFTLLHVYFSTYFIVPFLYVTNFASLEVGAHTRNFVCCGVYIFPKSLPP